MRRVTTICMLMRTTFANDCYLQADELRHIYEAQEEECRTQLSGAWAPPTANRTLTQLVRRCEAPRGRARVEAAKRDLERELGACGPESGA